MIEYNLSLSIPVKSPGESLSLRSILYKEYKRKQSRKSLSVSQSWLWCHLRDQIFMVQKRLASLQLLPWLRPVNQELVQERVYKKNRFCENQSYKPIIKMVNGHPHFAFYIPRSALGISIHVLFESFWVYPNRSLSLLNYQKKKKNLSWKPHTTRSIREWTKITHKV